MYLLIMSSEKVWGSIEFLSVSMFGEGSFERIMWLLIVMQRHWLWLNQGQVIMWLNCCCVESLKYKDIDRYSAWETVVVNQQIYVIV